MTCFYTCTYELVQHMCPSPASALFPTACWPQISHLSCHNLSRVLYPPCVFTCYSIQHVQAVPSNMLHACCKQVRLLLLAGLASEHLLLLGPPGTAKSELSRRLSNLTSGRYYERLLTRFSVPEELFGPLSMRGT